MKKWYKIFYGFILLFYIVLLIDVVFISRGSFRGINLIPFHTIREYIMVDNGFGQYLLVDMNIWGNILMFVPAGIYIILHNKNKTFAKNLFLVFLGSLMIEVIQYIFALGATDIDDIILNVMGGLIGILIYKVCKKLLKTEEKIQSAIAILSFVVGIPVFLLALLLTIANR